MSGHSGEGSGGEGRSWRPSPRGGHSRMDSNWNLQPIGPSAFTALNPDMVS